MMPLQLASDRDELEAANAPVRWNRALESRFLGALVEECDVSRAARLAGVSEADAWQARRRNKRFAGQWDEAVDALYDRVELVALRHCLTGATRTETVCDENGVVKQVKTVRSFPFAEALRLLQARADRDEVARQRTGQAEDQDDAVAERVRQQMAQVRMRLAARMDSIAPANGEADDADEK